MATTSLPLPSMPGLCAYAVPVPDQQEPEELIIDEAPPAAELEREARMTPAQAVAQMRIRVPAERQPQASRRPRARERTTPS